MYLSIYISIYLGLSTYLSIYLSSSSSWYSLAAFMACISLNLSRLDIVHINMISGASINEAYTLKIQVL